MEQLNSCLSIAHWCLPALAFIVVILCLWALLKRRLPSLGKAKIKIPSTGEEYLIRYRETSVGKGRTCDIVVDSPTVARVHGVIVCAREGWYIADSNGAGITVNGLKVNKRADIASGDKIGIGNITLIFENLRERV